MIGPDAGPASGPADTWAALFDHAPAAGGTKFLILHFRNAVLPPKSRLEVDLGDGEMDTFTGADGPEFWTRPINVYVLAGQKVPIRYIAKGARKGRVELDQYGRGERHAGDNRPSFSNCDPFYQGRYVEPSSYDPWWYGNDPPYWDNAATVTDPNDVRARVARSVGMIISVEPPWVSTCSVTLVGPDQVISAGHCMDIYDSKSAAMTTAMSSSVTFDYQTDAHGNRPMGYKPRFYKVKALQQYRYSQNYDYSLLQLAEAPSGIPVIQMRHDIPGSGEQIFGIHHPNGAVKKLSIPGPGFDKTLPSDEFHIRVPSNFAVSGGSSGSGLFDTAGRILGVLSNGNPQGRSGYPRSDLYYFPTATYATDVAPAPAKPVTRDVVVVFDRSGSMSLDDGTGRAKIDAAKDAVSLFVQLVKTGVGNRVGLESFSTTASSPADYEIAPVTKANNAILTGAAPFSGGKVGAIPVGGATSIGDGLDKAHLQLPPPAPGTNPRAVLLLTDGLQNTGPTIAQKEGLLDGMDVHAIGFGTEANLDGPILSALAAKHGGLYMRAGGGLALEKFFSHAFGNIFETGILMDPEYELPANQTQGSPQPFHVCGEDGVTVVAGWEGTDNDLWLELTSPGGAKVKQSSAGVQDSTGHTWTFMRIGLPYGGEQDGVWTANVHRFGGRGEISAPLPAVRYFLSVVPTGGPRLDRVTDARRYYTGDPINPLVQLRYEGGGWPKNARISMTVSRPDAGPGNLLSKSGLNAPVDIGGDTMPARQATLMKLEKAAGHPVIGYTETDFSLGDDPESSEGKFEACGVFGKPFADLLVMEGCYTFHYRAVYGDGCTATRELVWSLNAEVGVDPGQSTVTTTEGPKRPDGTRDATFVIVPRDRYGNLLGPGRQDAIGVSGAAGTTVSGPPVDNGDGSYEVAGVWDPEGGPALGIVVTQPGRPPVVLHPSPLPKGQPKRRRDRDDYDYREKAEELFEALDVHGQEVEHVRIKRIVLDLEIEEPDEEE